MKKTRTLKRFLSILLTVTMLTSTVAQPISATMDDPDTPSRVVDTDLIGEEADVSSDETEGSDPEQPETTDPEQTEEADPEQPETTEPDESDPEAKDWIEKCDAVITVGGRQYTPKDKDIPYPEGATISARFEWTVNDGYKLPEKYVYSLGDYKLKNDYRGGLLYDQHNREVGAWEVVRDTGGGEDKLVFTFEEWFRSENTKGRSFWVQLEGTVPLDPPGTGDDDENGFQIGEEWFDLDPGYQKGRVDLTKGMNDCMLDADGNLFYTVDITATVKGYVKELKLTDRLSGYTVTPKYVNCYSMTGLEVQLNGKELDETDYNYTASEQDEPWGFELTFNDREFKTGDKITITYTFKMEVSKFPSNSNSNSNTNSNDQVFPEYNTLTADGKDMITGDPIICIPVQAPVKLDDINLQLKKEGDYDPAKDTADPNLIKWTLTIDTGLAAPDNETTPSKPSGYLLNALRYLLTKKYPKLELNDVLGEGHHFRGISTDISSILSQSKIVVTKDKNGKKRWSIVYEYWTQPDNVTGITEYKNTATLVDDNKTIATVGPVGVPAYTLDKSAVNREPTVNPDDSVTMRWKIVSRIPGSNFGEFETFKIVDNPESNGTDTHRYKKGSLEVYVSDTADGSSKKLIWSDSPSSSSVDWLEFVATSDGGFELTVSDTNSIKQYHAKYLLLYYDTEVVDSQGVNVNFTNGEYQWNNTAEIEGKNIEDSDTYSQTPSTSAEPTIVKSLIQNVKEDETGDYVCTWLVRVNNIPVVARDCTESWNDVSSIELVDILPDGHDFEEGSLVATLYCGTSTNAERVVSSESIPKISAWLSEKLTYNKLDVGDDGKVNVSIKWNTPDGPCPDMEELKGVVSNANNDFYLALQYQSRLVDHSRLVKSGSSDNANISVSFKNTVGGTVNGKDVKEASASATAQTSSFGAKNYAYQSGWVSADYPDEKDWMYTIDDNNAAYPNMRFTIEINKPRLTAGANERGTVSLEDTMGSGLRLIKESIRLYNNDTQEYEENVTFNYADNQLTMNVPGGTHYTLTYWAEVLGDVGVSLNQTDYRNSLKLILNGQSASYNKTPSESKYGSFAGAQATRSFAIRKVDAEDPDSVLSGAEFTLQYGKFNDSGEFEVNTLNDDNGVFGPDDSDDGLHYYSFESFNDPRLEYVFRITEDKAPAGYKIGEPRYFVFTEYYKGDLSELPDFVEQRRFDDDGGYYSFPDDRMYAAAVFEGTKQINGRDWDDTKDDGAYTFTLNAVTAGAPMPETAAVTNEGSVIRFPEIKYTKAGTYKYKITETAVDTSKAPNVAMDPDPVYVTVTVVEDSNSSAGLKVTVRYSRNANEAGEESFTFINSCNEDDDSTGSGGSTVVNKGEDISNDAPAYCDNSNYIDIDPQADAGKTAGTCMILFIITAAIAVIRTRKRDN